MSNYSHGKLEVRYHGVGGKAKAIIVDTAAGTITFENCYAPRKLLAFTQPEFTCCLNDVLEVTQTTHRRTELVVATKTGRGVIRKKSQAHWDRLRNMLQQVAATTSRGPVSTTPTFGVVCLSGAIFGFVIGYAAWSKLSSCVIGQRVVANLRVAGWRDRNSSDGARL